MICFYFICVYTVSIAIISMYYFCIEKHQLRKLDKNEKKIFIPNKYISLFGDRGGEKEKRYRIICFI